MNHRVREDETISALERSPIRRLRLSAYLMFQSADLQAANSYSSSSSFLTFTTPRVANLRASGDNLISWRGVRFPLRTHGAVRMAKTIQAPENIQIAALKNKQQAFYNLMQPGNGVPWEDRGTGGMIGAFFKMCLAMMKAPARTLDQIRRPETTSDASGFSLLCGVFWALSCLVHSILYYYLWIEPEEGKTLVFNSDIYMLGTGLQMLIATFGVMSLTKFASGMYHKLISTEMKSKAPPVLTYNIFAYCLAPSILAPIPIAGPIIAALWIFLLWIVGGAKRLYVTTKGSVVAGFLTFLAITGILIGLYFVGNFAWSNLTGGSTEELIRRKRLQ